MPTTWPRSVAARHRLHVSGALKHCCWATFRCIIYVDRCVQVVLSWLCVSGLEMVASRVANTLVLAVAWDTRSLVLSKLLSVNLLASAPLVFDLSSPLLT